MRFIALTTVVALSAALPAQWSVAAAPRVSASMASAKTGVSPTVAPKVPIVFEANIGQADGSIAFLTHSGSSTLLLARDRLVVSLMKPAAATSAAKSPTQYLRPPTAEPQMVKPTTSTVSLVLVGANPTPSIVGLDRQTSKVNYYIGNDPTAWRENVPTFARVEYKDIYPGIDLMFYGGDAGPEHDWIVHPGADPSRIHLRMDGAASVNVARTGALTLATAAGSVSETPPSLYQTDARGLRRPVDGGYVLAADGKDVSFRVGAHDATTPLVIDPVLVFSTYLGGPPSVSPSTYADAATGRGIAVDGSHNVLVTGETASFGFPTVNAAQSTFDGTFVGNYTPNVFVSKFSPDGQKLLYSTYFGGSGAGDSGPIDFGDKGFAVQVDSAGNAYVAGGTGSRDFPVKNAYQSTCANPSPGQCLSSFLAKFDSTGHVVFSTFLGGQGESEALSLALLANGNLDVAGLAYGDFPEKNSLPSACSSTCTGYVAQFTSSGANPAFITMLPMIGYVASVAVDRSGAAYLTGQTYGGFPATATVGAAQPLCPVVPGQGCTAAYALKLAPDAQSISYATYINGANFDEGQGVAVDASGNAYITGYTESPDFPATSGVIQSKCGGGTSIEDGPDGCSDAFITEVNASGSAFVFSTFLGGSDDDGGQAIAVDGAGHIYVAGWSGNSTDFPRVKSIVRCPGFCGIFAARLAPGAATFDYSTDLGSGAALALAIDSDGNAYLTGHTFNNSIPVMAAYQAVPYAGNQSFVMKLQPRGFQALPVGGSVKASELPGGQNLCYACYAQALRQQGMWGDPIDGASGQISDASTDMAIPSRGLPLAFTRTYSSGSASTAGPLGYGWTIAPSASLAVDGTTGNVTVTQENGSQVVFVPVTGGYAPAAPRVTAILTHNSDGTWTLARSNREKLTFASTGRLTSEADKNGYALQLAYDTSGNLVSITDPAQRSLMLAYNGGHITSVTDPIGRAVSFGYNDGAGNVTDVTDVNGKHTTYTYDASHRMLSKQDPRGGTATNVYDASGRVTSQTVSVVAGDSSKNRTTTFAYSGDPTSASGGTTTITDPKGNVSIEQYTYGVRTSLTRGFGTPQAATWTYTYDPATLALAVETDPDGNPTVRSYDASGNNIMVVDPAGNITSKTYDSANDLTQVAAPDFTTTYQYNANGNLTSRSTPNTSGTITTTYAYTDSLHPGDVTSMTDPDGKVWPYSYDTYGDPATVTDPLGDKTLSCYDSVGRKVSTTTPRGTAQGVACATAAPAPFTSYATYDGAGDVLTSTDPLGHQVVNTYDADRNLASTRDGDLNLTQYAYDLANERTDVARADGTSLHTDYNPDGTIADQVDGAGHTTRYGYDSLGRLTSTTDALNRTTISTYDGAGNRVSMTDPQQQTTAYAYNDANQLSGITYSDGKTPNVSAITYDAEGRRTAMTDGTGASSWSYDAVGHMTSYANGYGDFVQYHYDKSGHLTTIDYPTGQAVQRGYDVAGRLTSVTDWLNNTTTYTLDADGNVTNVAYPNGTTASSQVDATGHIQSISEAPTAAPGSPFASFSYGRDGNDQVTSVSSAGVPSDTNTYDYTPLNQLGQVNAAQYSYDHGDNLTGLASGASQTFDAADEMTGMTSGATTVSYAYDQRGNRVSMTPSSGPSTTLTYDQADRLTSYGSAATYGYDGDGLRMSRSLAGLDRQQSVWDESGAVPLMLTDGSADFIYGANGAPLEQLSTPTLVGSAAAGDATSTALTIPLPAGARPGDLALVAVTETADQATPAVSGYTAVKSAQSGGPTASTTAQTSVFSRFLAAGDTQVTVSFPGLTPYSKAVTVAVYRGIDPSSAIDTSSTGGASAASAVTAQGVGTSFANDEVVIFQGASHAGPSSSWSPPPLASEVRQINATNTTAGVADFQWSQPNGTGGQTSTLSGSPAQLATVMLALRAKAAQPLFFHQDQLGSTRVLTDSTGAVAATFTYDSYGNLSASTGTATTPLLYAEQYRDAESSLYYLRGRYYDSLTAQFLSRDPAVSMTKAPYAYADDNPLNRIDPTGLSAAALPALLMSLPCMSTILADTEQEVAGSYGIQGLYAVMGIGVYAFSVYATLSADVALGVGATVAGVPGLIAGGLGLYQAIQKGDTLGAVLGGVSSALGVASIAVGVVNPVAGLVLGGVSLILGIASLFA